MKNFHQMKTRLVVICVVAMGLVAAIVQRGDLTLSSFGSVAETASGEHPTSSDCRAAVLRSSHCCAGLHCTVGIPPNAVIPDFGRETSVRVAQVKGTGRLKVFVQLERPPKLGIFPA